MKFYLGTHRTNWLGKIDVPLFVSHRKLAQRRSLPPAAASWCLDSGAFSQLEKHGHWTFTAVEYAEAVQRYIDGIGQLDWAAPMDWMCEPHMLARTGKTVREHQYLTVANYLELKDFGLPIIPVLQGWSIADYLHCIELYADAGVDLRAQRVVGVGTVCRRQSTPEVLRIMVELRRCGIHLHGFGVKTDGLRQYGKLLRSADSMAWSAQARAGKRKLEDCEHGGNCANCSEYALQWRQRVLAALP